MVYSLPCLSGDDKALGFSFPLLILNPHDDFHAYFVFPNKMIQSGSIGPDPYSERRMTSSLGGQYFLDAFVLAALSEENLHLIDPGLGIVLSAGLLLGYGKRRRAPEIGTITAVLLLLIIPPTTSNVTSLVVDVALFLGQFRTLVYPLKARSPMFAKSCGTALITAALFASKSGLYRKNSTEWEAPCRRDLNSRYRPPVNSQACPSSLAR